MTVQIKVFVVIIILCFCKLSLPAQTDVSEIINKTKALPKLDQPTFLNKSAEAFFRSDLTMADSLSKLALKIAVQIGNDTLIAQSHKYLAFINRNLGYYKTALEHAVESNKLFLQINDSMEAGFTFNLIGSVNNYLGNKENALLGFINSEKIYQEIIRYDQKNIPILNRLAILYSDMGLFFFKPLMEYEKSSEFFLKSLTINDKFLNDTMLKTSLLANLGMVYFKHGEETNALEYYTRALKMAEEQNNAMFAANINNNIGLILENQENITGAREHFLQSLNTYKKLKVVDKLGRIHNSIGYTYFTEKRYDSALLWYKNSIPYIVESGAQPELLDTYEKIYSIYSNTNQADSALNYYLMFAKLKDDISEEESEKRYQELLVKYETEKREKENRILKSTNEKQFITQIFLVILLGVSTILLIVIILYYRQHKKILNQKRKMAETENEALKMKLNYKNKELTTNAMALVNLNTYADSVCYKLKEAAATENSKECKAKLDDIMQFIKFNFGKNEWKEFQLRFEEVHNEFYNKLIEKHPDLTPTEIKTCAFLRLNMSSKDIASLTSKSYRTVETIRSNIRKKMQLQKEESLINYLLEI